MLGQSKNTTRKPRRLLPLVELLEAREVFAIRLDLVALHEFGHSLGLAHSDDPNSIMYAYYNANYNVNNFANDSAVATFRSLYSNVSTSPWKDSLDPKPGDGKVEITYSFMPDGARMDKGTNTLFATFNKIAPTSQWEQTFTDALNRWAGVSNNKVSFVEVSDAGGKFNYSGAAENDPNSGDIRIGAHRFDGALKVLAHTYYPPPNGSTAAGDSHYDQAEAWVLTAGAASAIAVSTPSTGNGSGNTPRGEQKDEPKGDNSEANDNAAVIAAAALQSQVAGASAVIPLPERTAATVPTPVAASVISTIRLPVTPGGAGAAAQTLPEAVEDQQAPPANDQQAPANPAAPAARPESHDSTQLAWAATASWAQLATACFATEPAPAAVEQGAIRVAEMESRSALPGAEMAVAMLGLAVPFWDFQREDASARQRRPAVWGNRLE